MKYLIALMILAFHGSVHAQRDATLNEKTIDTLQYRSDLVSYRPNGDSLPGFDSSTPNAFLSRLRNYESINNSVLTGGGFFFIRAKTDPLITVDDIPVNPIIYAAIPYKGFFGSPHLLSYDIQSVSVDPYTGQSQKIVSGQYNGSLDVRTRSISIDDTITRFFINNFSSLDFQTSDQLGYSIINNAGVERANKNISYRLSLTNGYHNGFIANSGMQRNGGNIKLIVNPIHNTTVTGFLDYSRFSDFKVDNDDQLKNKRIFAYIDIHSQFNRTFSLQAKGSLNFIHDNIDKQIIKEYIRYDGQVLSPERYTYQAGYESKSEYVDVRMRIRALAQKALNATILLGVSHQRTKEPYSLIEEYRTLSENESYTVKTSTSRAMMNDDKLYGKLNIRADLFSLSYLADINKYRFSAIDGFKEEDVSFGNHYVDIEFPILNARSGIVNGLSLQGKYARINSAFVAGRPHGTSHPNMWLNKNSVHNYEPSVTAVFLNSKVKLDFVYYIGVYDDYVFKHYPEDWNNPPLLVDLGKLRRSGIELNTMVSVVKNKDLEWKINGALSINKIEWTQEHASLNNTSYRNSIATAETALQFRNLRFIVGGERKRDFDFYYYRQYVLIYHPPANDPYLPKQTHETTRYLILKNIELQYRFLLQRKMVDEVTIAITFNKIRNLYPFDAFNDDEVQRPSFYNMLGISSSIRI